MSRYHVEWAHSPSETSLASFATPDLATEHALTLSRADGQPYLVRDRDTAPARVHAYVAHGKLAPIATCRACRGVGSLPKQNPPACAQCGGRGFRRSS